MTVPLALLTDSADRPRTFGQEGAREDAAWGGGGPRESRGRGPGASAPRPRFLDTCRCPPCITLMMMMMPPSRAILRWPRPNPPDSWHHPGASAAKPPPPRIEVHAPIIYHLCNHSLAILAKLHTLPRSRSAMEFTWFFTPFVQGHVLINMRLLSRQGISLSNYFRAELFDTLAVFSC